MRRLLMASLLFSLCAGHAQADSVSDFYKGRTLFIEIGYSAGGGYDSYARVLAEHLADHIPGHPTVVPQNMPGAGSLKAANYLYVAAPKDGTMIGTFSRGLAMEPLIGTSPTRFDATKFTWLGSIAEVKSVCVTGARSPIKTWKDALATTFTVAGEGSGSDPDIFATMLKNLYGAKIKLVTGYPGTNEMALAIERGEVEGRCGWSWTVLNSTNANLLKGSNKVNVILQLTTKPIADLPNVPTILDVSATERQKQIVRLLLSRQEMGVPFAAPPGIPADRAAALRKAFDETMKDPAFQAEAKGRGLDVSPVSGAEIEKLVTEIYKTPKDTLADVRKVIAAPAR